MFFENFSIINQINNGNENHMNIIDSVKILNLWGCGINVNFNCHKRFNFIIGTNGTGKTTVIDLIAASLTADFEKIDKTEFDEISITFKPQSGLKKKSISIRKDKRNDVPFYDLTYIFKQSQKDEGVKFDFDAIERERAFRGAPPRALRERIFKDHFIDVRRQLDEFVMVCWLSIHRSPEELRHVEDKRYMPAIDQKIARIKDELIKYFFTLSNEYSNEVINFQKSTLLSVLNPEKIDTVILFSNNIDIEKEKKSLSAIFDILGVDEKKYSQKIKGHFDRFNTAIKHRRSGSPISVDHFTSIYDVWRSHSLVQEYEDLQKRKSEIFKPRDNFINVINELLDNKKYMSLSEKNEITFKSKNKNDITVEELSSGEKQLFILLGEALLQRNKSCIYIADEPELSLHVSWQEALTDAICRLNPNAQIIFATHSPDIVGGHSDNLIHMDEVIK